MELESNHGSRGSRESVLRREESAQCSEVKRRKKVGGAAGVHCDGSLGYSWGRGQEMGLEKSWGPDHEEVLKLPQS